MWDADTGKCEMMIKTPDCEVTALRFLADYPAVAVASSDGRVRVWGAAESSQYRGVCVLEFFNAPPAGAALEELDEDEATMWIRPLLLPMVLRADEGRARAAQGARGEGGRAPRRGRERGPGGDDGRADQDRRPAVRRGDQAAARARQAGLAASAVPQPEPILFPKPWEKYQPRLPVLAAEDRRGLPEAVSPHPIAVTSLAFDAQRGALITGDEQGNVRSWSLAHAIKLLGLKPANSLGGDELAARPRRGRFRGRRSTAARPRGGRRSTIPRRWPRPRPRRARPPPRRSPAAPYGALPEAIREPLAQLAGDGVGRGRRRRRRPRDEREPRAQAARDPRVRVAHAPARGGRGRGERAPAGPGPRRAARARAR